MLGLLSKRAAREKNRPQDAPLRRFLSLGACQQDPENRSPLLAPRIE
jgi:hypothetical protein